ncbi:MAG: PAS domain S-box protein, partial [Rhodomicrobium sp.]
MRKSQVPWYFYFPRLPESGAWRYAIALAAFVISFFLREALDPWLFDRGFSLFLAAIILTAYFAGLGPAILNALLSGVAAWYFFLPPFWSFRLNLDGAVGLATFVLGSAVGITLVHRLRITIARVEAERARAEALARQRELLLEADPNGILVVDAAGRIQIVNNQIAKMFGYRRDELAGRSVEMLVPDRFRGNHASLRAGFIAHPSNRPMGAGRDLYGVRKDGSEFPVEIGLGSFTAGDGEMSLAIVTDITERKRVDEREKLLVGELEHRTKNLFAVVHALAHRSLRGNHTLDEAREAFLGRMQALMRADQRLTNSAWKGTSLSDIACSELEPFAGRFKLDGAEIELSPQAAQNFALAVHELATNASKYGALSTAEGRIAIEWSVHANKEGKALKFHWQEHGGPPVSIPKKDGFGAALLKATLGEGRIEFAAKGLNYEVDVPLAGILPRAETLQPDLIAADLNLVTDRRKNQEASH